MDSTKSGQSFSYRWFILALAWLSIVAIAYNQFMLSSLAYKIMPAFNLSSAQFASILMAPILTGVFISILAGVLADRYGVKKVVAFGLLLSIIGGFFRFTATSYGQLFVLMLLLGAGIVVLNSNIAKLLGVWFPRNQIGIAMGIYLSAGAFGTAFSQSTAALFKTLESAFVVSGSSIIILFLLWLIFGKSKPKGVPDLPPLPVVTYLGKVSKSKNIWLVGLGMVFFMGAQMSFTGFLPAGLIETHGLSPVKAGVVASIFTVGSLVGLILGPAISNGLGKLKPVMIVMSLAGAGLLYIAWILPQGVLSWIILAIGGFMLGAAPPILMTYPAILPEIGQEFAGSAGGLVSTLQCLGGFVLPSLIITPLAGNNFNILFGLAAVCCALIGVISFFLPELGSKTQAKMDTETKIPS